jgi:two-component system phosphate regulon sensor histidine kinase PhoR
MSSWPEISSWLLLLPLAGAAAWLASRGLRRIRLLTRFVEAVAADGELAPLPSPLPGDLGRLQTTLADMAEELRDRLARTRAQQRRLEAVLGGMVEGVIVIDAEGTVLLSNARAQNLLELPPDDGYKGRSLIELTRHPDLHDLVRWVMEAGEAERSTMREIALEGAQQRHVLQVTATPIERAPEASRAFILVFHDISELKKLERIRRDFVANVSHELRTPLAAISGYTETLLAGALDDPEMAPRFLGIIERHTERLGRLVDDLLVLSDLELGRTELRRGEVWAGDVIEATFEMLRPKAVPGGIALEQTVEEATPPLDADRDRLEQALLNLVDNAIKYTPRGGHVHVAARRLRPEEIPDSQAGRTGAFVEVSVADTGIGVPPEDLPRLTERFYRVDKARSREMGGTGLGLAIVKHIVQAHGGWMGIESQLGRGTTVRVFFPAYAEADAKQHEAESA